MMRDRLTRPLSAFIETGSNSDVQAHDVIECLLETFPREAIECVQYKFNGKFVVTFASEDEKNVFVAEEYMRLKGNSYRIVNADSHFRFVKIKNWPFEITNEEVRSLLEDYGRISEIRRDVHHESSIPNGNITVLMDISKSIPSYLYFCGDQGFIYYRDQQRTCRLCGSTSHIAKDCPTCNNCRHKGHNTEECLMPPRFQDWEDMMPVWPSLPLQQVARQTISHDQPDHCQTETTEDIPETPVDLEDSEPPQESIKDSMSNIEEASAITKAVEIDYESSESSSATSDIELTHTIAVVDEGPTKRSARQQREHEDKIKSEHHAENVRALAQRAAKRRKQMADSAQNVKQLARSQNKKTADRPVDEKRPKRK